jgi:hypothetical protein
MAMRVLVASCLSAEVGWHTLLLTFIKLRHYGPSGIMTVVSAQKPQAWHAIVLSAALAAVSAASAETPKTQRVKVGPNVFLEIEGKTRRVIIDAYVVLRQGMLEQLMCRKRTKEHEAILAADIDARDVHRALLVAGAKPGSVMRYTPDFQPPKGSVVRVTLQYMGKDGRTVTARAQDWVRDVKTHQALPYDWVFAGSFIRENPLDKNGPPLYGANSGDVICVSNFEDAMLDLPVASTSDNSELEYEAWTDRIPLPLTKVSVILEPVADKSGK